MAPGTFRALRHRNYRLYFLGQLISLIGTSLQGAAMTWLVFQMTQQSTWTALVGAAQVLPTFFLGPLGGILADRCRKRWLIFWTQTIYLVLALLLAAFVLGGVATRWHLLAIALANGLVTAVDLPARLAFVMDMVGREDLVNAVALNSLLFNVARALGPALGGILLAQVGAGHCFLLNALSFVAVLAALLRMDVQESPPTVHEHGGLRSLLAGFGYLAGRPRLAVLMLLAAVMSLFGWPYLVLLTALAQRHLGIREEDFGWLRGVFTVGVTSDSPEQRAAALGYGLLLSGTGIGALLAALLVASFASMDRRRYFLGFGVCISAPALFALSLATTLPAAVACSALLGCGLILFFATCQAVVQLRASDENRGRIMGIYSMLVSGGLPVGNLLAGRAADVWSEPFVLQLQAAGCGAAAVGLLVLLATGPRTTGKKE